MLNKIKSLNETFVNEKDEWEKIEYKDLPITISAVLRTSGLDSLNNIDKKNITRKTIKEGYFFLIQYTYYLLTEADIKILNKNGDFMELQFKNGKVFLLFFTYTHQK